MPEPIAAVAQMLSQESAYSHSTVLGFLQSAFRQYTPVVRECTHLTESEVGLARRMITAATAMDVSPSSLIPLGVLRTWTWPNPQEKV